MSIGSPPEPWLYGRRFQVLLIFVLLVGALALRLTGIAESSVEHRETQSALLARQLYLGAGEGLPVWKERVLDELPSVVKPIEPPVLDFLASLHFRTSGENFWFPRLLSSLAWVVGGIFLYLIGRRLTTPVGAIVALSLYLVWPFGVWLSRHFMPDATMVAALLAAVLAVIRYWERPSRGRFLAAGATSSLAAVVKPGAALFYLVALFVAIAVSRREARAALVGGRLPLFVALTAAAPALYYVYGTYLTDFIWSGADDGRVTPETVLTGSFWAEWWDAVSYLLRFPQTQSILAVVPLIAGVAGLAVADRGLPRAVMGGLSLGYVAFALTISNYTSANPYYSLPLIPILSLSIGVLAGFALGRLRVVAPRAGLPLIAAIALVVATAGYKSYVVLGSGDTRAAIADYVRIGELTNHTTRAIVVDNELSTPAMYWGWIVGRSWEFPDDRLPAHLAGQRWDFLVVVGEGFLKTSRGLREFTRTVPILAKTERYAVFDLRGRARTSASSSTP
jgi:4-amino-4-deoxy-L-arabinose transferase-like glycosyltransferase